MATLHHHVLTPAQPLRSSRRTRRAGVLAGLLAGALLVTPTAAAAPSGTAGARSEYDAVAAEVAAVAARVAEAEETLERLTHEAEAASGEAQAAQAALVAAQAEATTTAAELATARVEVEQSQDQVSTLGREAYMGKDDRYGDIQLLLDAENPTELLQQAATLEQIGEERVEVLETMVEVEAQEAQADRSARAAVTERDALARTAAEAQAAVDAQLASAQGTFDAVSADKAGLDARLRDAEIRLLAAQGIEDAERAWSERQAAEQAAEQASSMLSSAAGAVAPTIGRVTSCYGSRWGTLHAGIDIAAPIGTPVHSPDAGVVLQAGPASGFGLSVAVQHSDGTVTLYGHVNRNFVSVGETVSAGQQIAEVGNRGQSTGPHLHFEVHTRGFYVDRVNPMSWLNSRGISLGGGC